MINLDIKQLKKKGRKWVWIFFGLLLLNVFVLLCGILLKVQLEYIFAFLFLIGSSLYILSAFIIFFVFTFIGDLSEGTEKVTSLSKKLKECQSAAISGIAFSFLAIPFYFISWKISSILLSWTIINSSILINKLGKMSKILEEIEITEEVGMGPKPYEKYQKPSKKLRMYRKVAILGMIFSFLAVIFMFPDYWQMVVIFLYLTFITYVLLIYKFKKLRIILEEKEITQNVKLNTKPYLSFPRRKNNLMNNLIKINTWSMVIAFGALLFYVLILR